MPKNEKSLIEFLEGKRTYIVAALGIVTVALWYVGVVDDQGADKLLSLLGFGGLLALRASKK